jgi:tRNA threonylcarbamoyladenosine modification (KEOPS) complex Cgi121 subunit/molybdopterin converting factor small subunit
MITLRLLGGARKAVGSKSAVNFDRHQASILEILKFLQSISAEPRLLQPNNLIIAVNGVDSAALQGESTVARDGDTVTIVTVVHGGTVITTALNGNQVLIIGIRKVAADAGELVDRLRSDNRSVSIQAANADAVYGTDHVLGVLQITLEAEKRGIMLANRREAELLLRLACTDQISEAIKRAGLKKDAAGCFIAFSQDGTAVRRFEDYAKKNFELDDSLLHPTKQKRARLSELLSITADDDDDDRFSESQFLQYLLERAAILVK